MVKSKLVISLILVFVLGYLSAGVSPDSVGILNLNPIVENQVNAELVTEEYFSQKELSMMKVAADRNGCYGENYRILKAIRLSENGQSGSEYGIIHPKCDRRMAKLSRDIDDPQERIDAIYDVQCGWSAATIVKNRKRWIAKGSKGDFIDFLGNVYCPTKGDLTARERELNKNWIPNVRKWSRKFK